MHTSAAAVFRGGECGRLILGFFFLMRMFFFLFCVLCYIVLNVSPSVSKYEPTVTDTGEEER